MNAYRCTAHFDKVRYFPSKSNPSKAHEVKYDPKKDIIWCTCASWRFNHHKDLACKHVDEVVDDMCGWDQRADDTPVNTNDKGELCCPYCGGPVEELEKGES